MYVLPYSSNVTVLHLFFFFQVRSPLANSTSLFLRNTVVYDTIVQLWHSLGQFDEKQLDRFPCHIDDTCLVKLILAVSLTLAVRSLKSKNSSMSHIQGGSTGGIYQQASSLVSDGYHSISPAPSVLAVPNIKYEDPAVPQMESDESHMLFRGLDRNVLVLIRESLLPFYNSTNLSVPPQLRKLCSSGAVINMSYQLSLEEVTLIVTDGRRITEFHVSNALVPELLLCRLHINGTLKCTLESQALQSSQTIYLITVPSKQHFTYSGKCSNVVSKCSLSIDGIATNVSIPLMMLLRHTSESVKSKKTWCNTQISVQLKRRDSTLLPVTSCHQVTRNEETATQPSSEWLRMQSLLHILTFLETNDSTCLNPPLDSVAPSVLTTPGTVDLASSNQPDRIGSSKRSHSLSSVRTFGSPTMKPTKSSVTDQHCKSGAEVDEQPHPYYSTGSLSSVQHPESSNQKAVEMEKEKLLGLSTDTNGHSITVDMVDDTTDSMQILSSDNETTVQNSKAMYNFSQVAGSNRIHIGAQDALSDQDTSLSDPHEMQKDLAISDDKLQISFFGLVKINNVCITFQVESIRTVLEVKQITGSIDCRTMYTERQEAINDTATAGNSVSTRSHGHFMYQILPTYLSVASRFQQFSISVLDPAISKRYQNVKNNKYK